MRDKKDLNFIAEAYAHVIEENPYYAQQGDRGDADIIKDASGNTLARVSKVRPTDRYYKLNVMDDDLKHVLSTSDVYDNRLGGKVEHGATVSSPDEVRSALAKLGYTGAATAGQEQQEAPVMGSEEESGAVSAGGTSYSGFKYVLYDAGDFDVDIIGVYDTEDEALDAGAEHIKMMEGEGHDPEDFIKNMEVIRAPYGRKKPFEDTTRRDVPVGMRS